MAVVIGRMRNASLFAVGSTGHSLVGARCLARFAGTTRFRLLQQVPSVSSCQSSGLAGKVVTVGAFVPNDRLTKMLRLVQGGHKPVADDFLAQ